MKFLATLILAIAVSLPCSAQSAKGAPRYTGEQLLEHLMLSGQIDRNACGAANFRVATGYLHGVHDTTEGVAWCYAGKIKPDELDAYALWELKKMPADVLKCNAAPLLVEILRKKFPCH